MATTTWTIAALADYADYPELVKLFDACDDTELTTKLVKDIDAEIAKIDFTETPVDNYQQLLEKMEMDKDMPDEGVFTENLPNINGTLLYMMQGCANQELPPVPDLVVTAIKHMFENHQNFTEFYELYRAILPAFFAGLMQSQAELTETMAKLSTTMDRSVETLQKLVVTITVAAAAKSEVQ